ncbi:protein CFAP20DC isoform X3 [Hyla sarda]|uniref:protein CFAP20DC isoform X2 n=1 Tax=Hyla sarda TaxID=327740 RepID=UPI0024C40D6D|nr:protein CFAP20DC isoform X2 [Hyla sarda]XP_056380472.1 protein CFAP20DC isoform X3 [Hyla sarda]
MTYWAHRIQKPYEDSIMFKNEYQGGPHVDVFSAQGKDPVAKWRLFGGQSAIWKDFDKEVKSFVFVLEGSSQTIKMQLPKENKQMLGLIQRFLVLQLYIPLGQDFSAELLITDLANIKRRLYLSTVHKELSATPLHAKIPLSIIRRRVWCNLCIDLVAFTSGIFKSAVFQSLDGITISANCKLRKIYTMKLKPQDTVEQDIYESVLSDCEPTDTIPRSCQITTDVKQVTQVLDLSRVRNNEVREDGKFVLSTEADLLTHRGQGSSRDFKRGDKSHIAFGSKVLGPPPAPGRKASARSPGESTRSTSRHERSLQLLTQEKGASSLGHTTDTRIMSPTLYHPSDQRNKENIQQTKKKEPRPRGIDYHPHPPTDPLTNEKGRRLRTVGSAKKEQSKPVPDSSSVGHCRNEDKLSVQIHMPSCERENRPKTSSNAGADITDDWIFPDSFQDVSKLSDTLHQTYIGNLCEQLAGNSETDTVYPEERTPGDPDNIFSFSSMSGSVHHGKLQGQSFDRDTVSLEGLEHDRRGARMEDDFYGSDNSIEDDTFFQWTSSPKPDHDPTQFSEPSHSVDITNRSSIGSSNTKSNLKASISNTDTEAKKGCFSTQKNLMPTRSLSPSGSRNEISKGNSVISQIQQFVSDKTLRTSMSKKSLKEIPKEERKIIDGASAYNWRSYNVNRLSASEMQMLASLKRQQNEEMEDEGTSHGLSQSQIDHCNISMSTSSDDTTTWNSCLPPPVNQGSHYQTEMNPLAQSNPRDWLNAFSPPIIPTSQNQNKDPLLKLKESRLNCNEGDDGIGADEEEDILTLLYDPCLNCYFDPETGKYYELA